MGSSFMSPWMIGLIVLIILALAYFIYRNYLSTSNEIDKVVDDANTAADEAVKAADTASKTATTEEEKSAAVVSNKAAQESVNAAANAKTAADTAKIAKSIKDNATVVAKEAETIKVTTEDPQEAEEAAIVQEKAEKEAEEAAVTQIEAEKKVIDSTKEAANKAGKAQAAAATASPNKTYECANNFASALDGLEFDVPSWNGKVIYARNEDYIEGKLLNDNDDVQQHFRLQPTGISGITKDPLIYTGNADMFDMRYHSKKEDQPKWASNGEFILNVDDKKFMYNGLPEDNTIIKMPACFS